MLNHRGVTIRGLAAPTTGETGASDAVTTSSDVSIVDLCRPVVHKKPGRRFLTASETFTEADNRHMYGGWSQLPCGPVA